MLSTTLSGMLTSLERVKADQRSLGGNDYDGFTAGADPDSPLISAMAHPKRHGRELKNRALRRGTGS